MKEFGFENFVKFVLAGAIVGAFLYMAVTTEAYKDALIGMASMAAGYWLGSSAGSAKKDQIIRENSSNV